MADAKTMIATRKSYILAGAILLLVVLWLASGAFRSDSGSGTDAAAATDAALMSVRVRDLAPEPYAADLVVKGRTEAVRRVELKAQIDGFVARLPVEKGARVKKDDVICELAVEDRAARLAEAEALAAQRALELNAAKELAAKGHRAPTQVAAAQAQHDAAIAQVEQMKTILSQTRVRAPFDGIVDERQVEIGAYLLKGGTCATILDIDPYLVIGAVSERDVGRIKVGQRGRARLVDGTEVEGRIRYVAAAAEPETRTFRVELEVPNPENRLRHGVTAEIRLPLGARPAHRVPRSALVLDDSGRIGVRVVEEPGIVRFLPVEILGDDPTGLWVGGIEGTIRLITAGQQFVSEGQRVEVHDEGGAASERDPA